MNIRVVIIEDKTFKVTNTIKFDFVGGSFLDEVEKELKIKKEKKFDLKTNVIISDIKIFQEDYFANLREKIAVITKIPPGKQLLFEDKGKALGFEYVIDGVYTIIDPYELLTEYKEDNNILFKYQGSYSFKDYSLTKIGKLKDINVLSSDSYFSKNDILGNLYQKKFWPLANETYRNYDFYVNESKTFSKILSSKPFTRFYVNETISYINRYTPKKIDVGLLMNCNLQNLNAKYCYMYKGKHIFKYINMYKIRRSFDPAAFNIYLSLGTIKLTINVYPNGKIRLVSYHHNVQFDIVKQAFSDHLPCVFKELGLVGGNQEYESLNVVAKYTDSITSQVFNKLKDINDDLNGILSDISKYNDKYTMVVSKNVNTFYNMSITNEHTRLSFLIEKVQFQDLDFVNKLITYYFSNITSDKTIDIDINKINRNKRLRERDPVAYSSSEVDWSRRCQKANQPVIFNKIEYESLKKEIKDNTIKYWNFTTKEEAYFYCPNPAYKFLGFKNINDMGLPCCQKRSFSGMSKDKQDEYNKILKTHIYIKTEEKVSSRYEVMYSTAIGIDRIMELPPLFKRWIHKNNVQQDFEYKFFGVSQVKGIDGCYEHAIGNASKDTVNLLLIKDRKRGEINEFLLANDKYDLSKKFLIVISQKDKNNKYYYPLYGINSKRYNTKKIIDLKLFTKDDFIVKNFISLKRDNMLDLIESTFEVITKYTFNDIILYILVKKGTKHALLPLNIPLFEVNKQSLKPPSLGLDLPIKFLLEVLEEINVTPNIDHVLVYQDKQIGFISEGLVYHHNPIPLGKDSINRIFINYDLEKVYSTIYKKEPGKPLNPNIDNTVEEEVNVFKNKLFNKKDEVKRKEITDIFKKYSGSERLYYLHNILNKHDYDLIKATSSLEEALSIHYNFDNKDIEYLAGLDEPGLTKYLSKYSPDTVIYLKTVIQNTLLYGNLVNETLTINIKKIKKWPNEKVIVLS